MPLVYAGDSVCMTKMTVDNQNFNNVQTSISSTVKHAPCAMNEANK